jgi:hypothetical protein
MIVDMPFAHIVSYSGNIAVTVDGTTYRLSVTQYEFWLEVANLKSSPPFPPCRTYLTEEQEYGLIQMFQAISMTTDPVQKIGE